VNCAWGRHRLLDPKRDTAHCAPLGLPSRTAHSSGTRRHAAAPRRGTRRSCIDAARQRLHKKQHPGRARKKAPWHLRGPFAFACGHRNICASWVSPPGGRATCRCTIILTSTSLASKGRVKLTGATITLGFFPRRSALRSERIGRRGAPSFQAMVARTCIPSGSR